MLSCPKHIYKNIEAEAIVCGWDKKWQQFFNMITASF